MSTEVLSNPKNEEIDLGALVKTIWEGRMLIALVTFVTVAIAAAYAFLSKPVYEAEGAVIAPHASDIADFNIGRTPDSGLAPITTKDVYELFMTNLQSDVSKHDFFEKTYLPSLPEEKQKGKRDALYKEFENKIIKVEPIDKTKPDIFSVKFQSNDPNVAVDWVREYIKVVSVRTREEVLENVTNELKVNRENIENLIAEDRVATAKSRSDRLAQLREALVIAKAVNIKKPQVTTARAPAQDNVASYIDGSEMYARGSLALESEIKVLESRKSDDPFVASLRGLEKRLALMAKVKNDIEALRVYRFYQNVNLPESPIKPKKLLILISSLIFGVMIGCVIVSLRRSRIK